jgi:PAS domain S-box-containing protein
VEAESANSGSLLRTVINTELECVILVSPGGAVLDMNPAGLAMFEADVRDQLIGKLMISLVDPAYVPDLEAHCKRVFDGASEVFEFEITGLKGARRRLECRAAPIRDEQGETSALLGVARDITEHARWEKTLQEQLRFLEALLDAIPIPVFYKNTSGVFQGCNKAFASFVGWSKENLIGKTAYDVAPKELADVYTRKDAELFAKPGVQISESLARHADGTLHDILLQKAVYTDSGGNVAGVISAIQDITERKQTEKEREKLIKELQSLLKTISRSQKDWQDTFDSITDMISIMDREFTILRANKAFAAYYGLHPRDVINRKCYEFLHASDSPAANCPHVVSMEGEKPASYEMLDPRNNNIFRIFTFPYFSPEGDMIGSIHIARNITDEKEQEMRLLMSERFAALGEMASGIAHEINNPLASIAGCSEGMLDRIRTRQYDYALFESYLNIIQEEVFRCKSIITAMLSFARKTTYEKKDIDVHGMLDKTLEIIGFQGRLKSVEVRKRYAARPPALHGSEGELRQVFIAVIANALDAMEDKGILTLETDAAENGMAVRISDTGPGIAADLVTKVFDPFFTTKMDKGGTGLGLSIARKIVLGHGGKIDAFSEQGKGATFTITLPHKPR